MACHGFDIDIYLLQLGFHPVAAVGRLYKKLGKRQHKRRNNTKTENTQNNTQKYKTKNRQKEY
jgi:hypothetical protein